MRWKPTKTNGLSEPHCSFFRYSWDRSSSALSKTSLGSRRKVRDALSFLAFQKFDCELPVIYFAKTGEPSGYDSEGIA